MDKLNSDDRPVRLSLEENNQARLQALNAIGFGVNGVNEALTSMMMAELLGPVATERVKREHQEWLSDQLTQLEEKVTEIQRKQSLHLPGRG